MIRQKIRLSLNVILMAFEMEMKQNLTDAFILFGVFVQPLIIAFLALWMLKDQVVNYAIFVAVGSGMTGLWTQLLFCSGNSITGERWTGTLESLVGTPVSLRQVVFGKNLANIIQALLSMLVCYTLISLMIGAPLRVTYPWWFTISIILTIFAFVSFGLIMSTLFILNPEVQRFQNGLEFPIYILSGFLFPVALLPGWTIPLSYLLAPYWAAQALHGAARGTAVFNEMLLSWSMLVLFSFIYLLISKYLFDKVLIKARKDATLDMQ